MSRYQLSEDAAEDLAGIAEYIAADEPSAAERVVEKFTDAFSKLAENPGMGHRREDLTDEPVLFWPVYSYLIIYLPGTKPLRIARVLSGFQDVEELLK